MTRSDDEGGDPSALAPPPARLLERPLDYILADHDRERHVCNALGAIARAGRVDSGRRDAIVAFLERDLVLHHLDEEQELFPALQRRAHPDDDLGEIIARLADDHHQAQASGPAIIRALSAAVAADGAGLGEPDRARLLDFAGRELRHLAVENAIVMVIARKRLARSDLEAIRRAMKARRGC